MLELIAYVIVAVVFMFLARRSGMRRSNPISAFCIFWIPALIICHVPGALGTEFSDSTWLMIWIGSLSIFVAAFTGWHSARVSADRSFRQVLVTSHNLRRFTRMHLVLVAMLLGFGLLQVYQLLPFVAELGGWGAVFSSAGGELKNNFAASRIALAQSGGAGGSVALSVLGYVLFLGHASLFSGALLWRHGQKFLAVLPLAVAAAYSVVSLQRTSFAMAALLFVFAVLAYGPAAGSTPARPRKVAIARGFSPLSVAFTSVAAAAALFIPLAARNAGTTNSVGLISLAQYFIGGVAGLDARNTGNPDWGPPPGDQAGSFGPAPGYGAYTFNSFFTLVDRYGGHLPRAPHDLDYYVVEMFGSYVPTNVGTIFTVFRLDLGWAGLVVFSLLLGFLAGFLCRRAAAGATDVVPFCSYLLGTICWSFFVAAIPGDFRYALLVTLAPMIIRFAAGPTGRRDVRPEPERRDLGHPARPIKSEVRP